MEANPGVEREVVLIRGQSGFDFSIKGGSGLNLPVIISRVFAGGVAERSGQLHYGDEILSVNGNSLKNASHEDAVRFLKGSGTKVTLVVRSTHGVVASESVSAALPPPVIAPVANGTSTPPATPRVETNQRAQSTPRVEAPASSRASKKSSASTLKPVASVSSKSEELAYSVPDVYDDVDEIAPDTPLPENWSIGVDSITGRTYFNDHVNGTSTWIDPRTKNTRKASVRETLPTELPYGFERVFDAHDNIFYIDHVNQITTFLHPWDLESVRQKKQMLEFLRVEQAKVTSQLSKVHSLPAEIQHHTREIELLYAEQERLKEIIAGGRNDLHYNLQAVASQIAIAEEAIEKLESFKESSLTAISNKLRLLVEVNAKIERKRLHLLREEVETTRASNFKQKVSVEGAELLKLRIELDRISAERERNETEIERLLSAFPGGNLESNVQAAPRYYAPAESTVTTQGLARGTIVEMEVEKVLLNLHIAQLQASINAMSAARASLAEFKAKTEGKAPTRLPQNISSRPWIEDWRRKANAPPSVSYHQMTFFEKLEFLLH
ncbi:hypothetical protein CAOG_03596 [Capsaspora owczarzaki ATCC 30864]|uniref:Uncharacterized protein n=1 Tax=Capsaspora owczarzaki (strain ATCC 30864) TaxID=595528 RepID=A0A0D2X2J7_CAPO3|nr:hypothetical protein CAOG_03596 [Capsaspora owczarzaki ATCC 30864]KJE92679.1 hypothetical protein CAOG_003596 [Capsaspora owczarzaki ATCC 30864]|eukprot:XP_004363324.1 hypothetical protein CAOG_03596 [Capsaspora owczarzaki ATCC 30864]